MKNIWIKGIGLILTATLLLLSGCIQPAENDTNRSSAGDEVSAGVISQNPTQDSAQELSAAEEATVITWNGDTFSCSDTSVEKKEYGIKISRAGIYRITGTMNDGQIRINPDVDGDVTLILDNASLNCSDSAPVYAKKGTNLTVVLTGENYITDGAVYTYETADEDEPNAALFSKENLTIRGSGSLTVQANYNNGIGCKGSLTLEGGNFSITSVNHAVKGKEAVVITGGSYTVQSAGDGIHAGSGNDDGTGALTIQDGLFTITAGEDGIQAEQTLTVVDGTFTVICGNGADAKLAEDASAKALKGQDILIEGGTFELDSTDDTVHANQTVRITGGSMQLRTGDDGIHADQELTINGGEITISQCYEGLEAARIHLQDGSVRLVASDDGINAADGSGGGAVPGWNPGSTSNMTIQISGGFWVIDAGGDGLDSNGSIEMSGGTLLIHGPVSSADGALDYDGSFKLTGGTLIAVGAGGMAQNVSEASNQGAMLIATGQQSAGTLLYVQNEKGETLFAFTPSKAYSCAVISSPLLQEGGTYTVFAGGTCDGLEQDGLYTEGSCGGGEQVASVTLSSLVYSDSGTGGMGAMGGHGGMGTGHGPQMPDPAQGSQMTPPGGWEQNGRMTPPDITNQEGAAGPTDLPDGAPDPATGTQNPLDEGTVSSTRASQA